MVVEILAILVVSILGVIGWLASGCIGQYSIYLSCGLICAGTLFEITKAIRSNKEKLLSERRIKELLEIANKKAVIEIRINNRVINDGDSMQISDEQKRELAVKIKNIGNKQTSQLQFVLLAPEPSFFSKIGKTWIDHGEYEIDKDGEYIKLSSIHQYSFIAPCTIYPGNWMGLGTFEIKPEWDGKDTPIKLKVYYADDTVDIRVITLRLT